MYNNLKTPFFIELFLNKAIQDCLPSEKMLLQKCVKLKNDFSEPKINCFKLGLFLRLFLR